MVGQTTSLWMTATTPRYFPLAGDISGDVCVVGAGIAGLTTAYLLAQEGMSVVVLDTGPITSGQTQRTTAHLSNAIDSRYCEIEKLHGEEGARLTADSHTAAIDCIERIVAREEIECGFERVDGYLFLAPQHTADLLEDELKAAHRAGLLQVERLPRAESQVFETGPCLRFPRQGQFHPVQYLSGVAEAIVRDGGRIFSQTHVTEIVGGAPATVRTRNGSVVTAGAVVVATNTPVNDTVAMHTKQAAYRTYVISGRIPAGALPKALFWDTQDPYHYIRLYSPGSPEGSGADGYDTVIIGGEDHKTGQNHEPEACWARLEHWSRSRLPVKGAVERRWSGQVIETIDGLAFIGRNPMDADNVYISTGDCGMGMTHGTVAGMLLTDLIMGRYNAWAALYDPSRKNLRAALEFARENTNVAWQYTDWLTPGEISSTDEVDPGCGALMRCGLSKCAVYCDEHGTVHQMSAVCTHLGGIVQWNPAEHTWDCPAHGSRFDPLGHVVNGPANSDLETMGEPCLEEGEAVSEDDASYTAPLPGGVQPEVRERSQT